jgi:predicted nucleotidyltransferase
MLRAPYLNLDSDVGAIDLINLLPGVDGFDGMYSRREVFEIEGVGVSCASLDDIIALKGASSRPKDQLHLEELRALRRLRDEL